MTHKVKKRGQSYNIKQLEELMDEGLTPKEIADELGTKSVQSVRHRVEAIRKERDAISFRENRQRMEKEKVNSMNRVGLFPYVADELSINALKYLLPLHVTGLNIVKTETGYVILVDPGTYSTSVRKDFKLLGNYGRLCSKRDRGDQIRMMSNPSSHEELSWTEMIRYPFTVACPYDDELKKLQAFLYSYLKDGTINSMDINNITLGAVEDPEYTLKSMQLDADKSPWHVHIEYDPMIITKIGYIPVKLNGNDLELIFKETLNNLGNRINEEISQEFFQNMDQFILKVFLCKMAGGNWKVFRKISKLEIKSNYLTKIIGSISIFMTEEIRQKLEEEIDKNAEYVNEILEREGSDISNLI